MKYSILIVDDEAPSRDELSFIVASFLKEAVIFEAANGEKALDIIKNEEIDVAFIDINMPGMDGIALSKEINALGKNISIVFATAYDLYAVKAFEMNAVDYILKPFEEDRVKKTVDKLIKDGKSKTENNADKAEANISGKKFKKLSLWKGDRVILVDIADIVYIEAEERNTIINTIGGQYTSNQTISALEDKLTAEGFYRVHRSYLINLEHVKEVQPWFNGAYNLIMSGYEKDEIPVSRKQVKEFKELLGF